MKNSRAFIAATVALSLLSKADGFFVVIPHGKSAASWKTTLYGGGGRGGGGYSPDELDNYANQCNPNNDAYWSSRGYDDSDGDYDSGDETHEYSQDELDNHANQCNPNHEEYNGH
mmetsp:Transcript_88537/g.132672  ORF Transcript_88537/g.132672 Transcript_88537/m.132672 type:complete len:115 (-) Transcript_88537:92-436(-)|eukprot:CAMPEP_0117057562 /NCGR_PEP_ID=MMETSP0472-20121206/39986_1 /TAXON_ID=693140 ORGANISM="Tiarina fusus, Strain LIS" /NCGR_SAMPLE_ID=MMETSP0472 /ASSEMBLY_ACC=CAM_ASM_000603 /LENGTH=114 /DNA_ID=CAMNT_0004774543 /DNA_START=126 /DNA_END=470 /DNA_ORIENTATION=+